MAHFNLDDYETVAQRVIRLKSVHPNARIITSVVKHDPERGEILAQASIYLDEGMQASDYAFGVASTYPQSMRKFYVEDTITSAIGRAISLVIPTEQKPTREDMQKVQQHEQTKSLIAETKAKLAETAKEYVPVPVEDDPWTIRDAKPAATVDEAVKIVDEIIGVAKDKDIPRCTGCHDKKLMSWATGVSAKTKKPWGKFGCFVCKDVVWYEIASDGSWQPQKKYGN